MSSVQPPAPYVPPTNAPAAPVEGEAVPAEIVKLPPALANTDRALTLRGEVQAQNPDGSVRIATPRGAIDVKLPEPVPQRGQTVEVQVPAGTPPRAATVTLPPQQQPPQQPETRSVSPNQPPVTQAPVQNGPPQNIPGQPQPAPPTPHAPASTPQQPQAQTPLPQQPHQPATMPRDEVSVRPQTQTPQPAAAGQPQPQTSAPQQSQLSPQGLLNFMKTSLQTLMRAPVAGNDANVQTPQTQGAIPQQQRPLQLGQMLRLTFLPAGQNAGAPDTPVLNAPQTMPVLTPSMPALPGQPQIRPQTLILMPQGMSPAPAAPMPLQQNLQQTLQSPMAAIVSPQGTAAAPVTLDPLARLLTPVLPAAGAPSAPALPVPAAPLTTQMPATPNAPQIPQGMEVQPHQPVIAARPGIQIPALTQPMDVRVTAMLPVASNAVMQSPAVATLLHGSPTNPVMFARITGQTQQGLPVVELPTFTTAPDGTQKPATATMVLQFPARALPPSTILQLNILPMTQGASPLGTSSFSTLPTLGDSITWDALDDVIRAPGQSATQAAALQAAIPRPGAAAFTAPVLMMASALRSGDLSAWMGEKGIDALKTARRADALARIGNDFAAASRRMDEPAQQGEWKALSLPMLYGQDVGRIQLYYRSFTQGESDQGGQSKNNGTRFVMDLSLTRMGPLQIDGFSVGNKLDVTLRSEQALSAPMRETMRQRYHDAIKGIGFAGELNFNADPNHKTWVVMDDSTRTSASA